MVAAALGPAAVTGNVGVVAKGCKRGAVAPLPQALPSRLCGVWVAHSTGRKVGSMSDMVAIREEDLVDSVADALQFISYYHPMDYIRALGAAYQAEQGPAAKDAIAQILTNSRMCAEGHRPICQDTGIVNVFVKWGQDCRLESSRSLQEVVDDGVRRAYTLPENKLRASILADPAFTRRNTRDNTPCVLSVEMVPGRTVSIDVAAKGGGSENKSKFKMMNPSDNIVDWVVEMIPQLGAGWCPPGMLGIGIGGTAEHCICLL
jgi:fumarate hydratase class I